MTKYVVYHHTISCTVAPHDIAEKKIQRMLDDGLGQPDYIVNRFDTVEEAEDLVFSTPADINISDFYRGGKHVRIEILLCNEVEYGEDGDIIDSNCWCENTPTFDEILDIVEPDENEEE